MAIQKNNYTPQTINTIAITASTKPIKMNASVHLAVWPLALMDGVATANGGALTGAAVLIGEAANFTPASAKYLTFTDAYGMYGISLPAPGTYFVKIYS